jgi:magnesium chelatase family protein
MNPCPCGWLGSERRACTCAEGQVRRYRGRVSGPLLDRLDLHVEIPALAYDELAAASPGEPSAAVALRVLAARRRQQARQGRPNGALPGAQVRELVELEPAARALLRHAIDELGFSARAHDRVLRLALTIRDLAGGEGPATLDEACLAEALAYRFTDRPARWRAETAT